jgi:hypothetical protein
MASERLPRIDVGDIPAFIRVVEVVRRSGQPTVLYSGDEELGVLTPSAPATDREAPPNLADPADIWAGYDPERVRKALAESADALKGIDRDELLADLAVQRQQHSRGRPSDR